MAQAGRAAKVDDVVWVEDAMMWHRVMVVVAWLVMVTVVVDVCGLGTRPSWSSQLRANNSKLLLRGVSRSSRNVVAGAA